MRTLSIFLLFVAGLIVPSHTAKAADVEDEIKDLLTNQTDAWNRGNLEEFVKPYAEDCVFVGKQVVKGRDQVLARYKRLYSTKAIMGNLAFRNLEVREAGERMALVIGEWELKRPSSAGGNVRGIFSLILKNVDDDWRIVLDHTS